jgi:hypothetical protein
MHLLQKKHSIGHIKDIMKVLYITNKVRLTDTIEKFYIYKETKPVIKSMTKTLLSQIQYSIQ